MYTCTYTKSCALRVGPDQSQSELRQARSPFCRCRDRARRRPSFDDARPFSEEEERWITLGRDVLGRLLVVVYTWRGESVRLISARPATVRETTQYEEHHEA